MQAPRSSGLARARLGVVLSAAWQHRLTLVTAPAGSGKTTLLGQFAASAAVPVAWYRAESTENSSDRLLEHLAAALAAADTRWAGLACDSPEALAADVTDGGVDRGALVIDDLHTLRGTAAEGTLERLIECLPAGVVVVAGTRVLPRFNLSRLRVSGELLEVGADELRFRSWEVEELFRQVYGEPLRPEDLAQLARRTAGWAAGLQLFHLATRGKSFEERTLAVTALARRHGLVHEYLVRNVLDELEPALRSFVLGASALGRMSGELCDDLLESTGSARHLDELEQRQLFTTAVEPAGWYRFHEVLRFHAEAAFIEEAGEERARLHRLRAAALLEKAGAWSDALQVYCRAGEWEAAGRLVGLQADGLVAGPWVELLPEDMVGDSWVLLAAARRHRASGRVAAALDAYTRAERAFGTSSPALVCRAERLALADWTVHAAYLSSTWSGILRSALARDPAVAAGAARALGHDAGALAGAVADLLAGRVTDAGRQFDRLLAATTRDSASALLLGARLGRLTAGLLAGAVPLDGAIERLVEECEEAEYPWLADAARALLAGTPDAAGQVTDADPFGAAFRQLLQAWRLLEAGQPVDGLLDPVVDGLGFAPVAQAWALALQAVGRCRTAAPGGRELARHAERVARAAGAPGPLALAYLALSVAGGASAATHLDQARTLAGDLGLHLPGTSEPAAAQTGGGPGDGARPAAPPRIAIRCLGGFDATIDSAPADFGPLKPRVRSLLRFLAMHGGRPVHRETIIEALWPEVDADAGTRNLQVALSSLRQYLDDPDGRDVSALGRDGDAYRLTCAVTVDVAELDAALAEGRSRRRDGDAEGAVHAYGRALDLYRGELLPEEGPAEWVVAERERLRIRVAEAAAEAARLAFDRDDIAGSVSFCERGLAVDQLNDAVWQLLIAAHEAAGSLASATQARCRYASVLDQLGLAPEDGGADVRATGSRSRS